MVRATIQMIRYLVFFYIPFGMHRNIFRIPRRDFCYLILKKSIREPAIKFIPFLRRIGQNIGRRIRCPPNPERIRRINGITPITVAAIQIDIDEEETFPFGVERPAAIKIRLYGICFTSKIVVEEPALEFVAFLYRIFQSKGLIVLGKASWIRFIILAAIHHVLNFKSNVIVENGISRSLFPYLAIFTFRKSFQRRSVCKLFLAKRCRFRSRVFFGIHAQGVFKCESTSSSKAIVFLICQNAVCIFPLQFTGKINISQNSEGHVSGNSTSHFPFNMPETIGIFNKGLIQIILRFSIRRRNPGRQQSQATFIPRINFTDQPSSLIIAMNRSIGIDIGYPCRIIDGSGKRPRSR